MRDDPYPNVPQILKQHPQWVMWQLETRNSKPTKIPKQTSGNNAQTNKPQTWTSYESVCEHEKHFTGIGFVFSQKDAYCGVDLDYCLKNGQVKEWAKPIVDRLKDVAYGEVSPSGNGIKFFTEAVLPANAKHKVYFVEKEDAIEIYDKARFFTITGKGKGNILDGQSVIDWIVQKYLTSKKKKSSPEQAKVSPIPTVHDTIKLIQNSKQCHKFDALMAGNTTGYGSQSEADLGLVSVIAFWVQDENIIDAIFRQSKLYRDKWDEKHRADGATYGKMTIETALSERRETYTPPQQRKRPYTSFYKERERRRRYGRKK